MRYVFLVLFLISPSLSSGAVPPKQHTLSFEELTLEISRDPDSVTPRIELAKIFIKRGDKASAHAHLAEVLNRNPANENARTIMKEILLSDAPFLGNTIAPALETKLFIVPSIPKNYEFVKTIQIDSFGERWQSILKDSLENEKITLILFESDEAFLVASNGRRRSFANKVPRSIGLDPNLDRDQFVDALKEGLVDLWIKINIPKGDLPKGIKFGLAGNLSPILLKPKRNKPIAIVDILDSLPKNETMKQTTIAFLAMLQELNPEGFPKWLKGYGATGNPMTELLNTFHFNNWSEVHSTFNDYLKKQSS